MPRLPPLLSACAVLGALASTPARALGAETTASTTISSRGGIALASLPDGSGGDAAQARLLFTGGPEDTLSLSVSRLDRSAPGHPPAALRALPEPPASAPGAAPLRIAGHGEVNFNEAGPRLGAGVLVIIAHYN